AELGLAGRNPKRRGAAVLAGPDPPVRERAVHVQAPQASIVVNPPRGVRKRPAPGGVLVEGKREEIGHLVGLRRGYAPDRDSAAHRQRPSTPRERLATR